VAGGGEERLLLLEHPPVITLGRRPGLNQHLLASNSHLKQLGVEVVQSDRGGDITFHGLGQLVAYPILRLADHGLSVSSFVHRLEQIAIATLADFGIDAAADAKAVGVWTDDGAARAKICAIGVRIRKGISLHGLALNVATDLRYFELIVPCGLHGRAVTSVQKLLGERAPSMAQVKERLRTQFRAAFAKAPIVSPQG
jgi:lipoyl(octanoyl) transferase